MADLHVISFGYGHDEPLPEADITLDLRRRFRDPHVDATLRELTGRDARVIDKVMTTPGVTRYVHTMYHVVQGLLELDTGDVTVAVGCVGGKHRAPVIGAKIADKARLDEWTVTVDHLHIDRPVLERPMRSAVDEQRAGEPRG